MLVVSIFNACALVGMVPFAFTRHRALDACHPISIRTRPTCQLLHFEPHCTLATRRSLALVSTLAAATRAHSDTPRLAVRAALALRNATQNTSTVFTIHINEHRRHNYAQDKAYSITRHLVHVVIMSILR